jgi:methylenetetrahydrofolate dehydrogenase (NADP+) / methenyltetrahydrofolate cyclohydrolase
MKIDGKQIANEILEDLKIKVKKLKEKNITPHLAIILVGNNPASITYVNQKKIKAEQIGAKTTIINLPNDVSESELIEIIGQFNEDKSTHGIIVQQPLPQNINIETIVQSIDPKKDVDGFNSKSKFEMPIALAILEALKTISSPPPKEWLRSKNIVIIGKGETGGKPIIESLQELGIKPLIIDSKTPNPELITKNADIIISAVGKANIIRPEMIKQNVILIGVGQHKENGKIIGDYPEEKIKNIVSFYTPTPGGVGPIDVSMLLKNLVAAAEGNFILDLG